MQPDPNRRAIGLKFDDGRLYVAGGPLGRAYVYDASNGALIADVKLTDNASFINDVTLTNDAAYFTDSMQQQLYRVDRQTHQATAIPITGDFVYDSDPQTFEANGIAATNDGRSAYVIQSGAGRLYLVDLQTGQSRLVPVTGGVLTLGDGLLRHGQRLYVVRNRENEVAVVDLNRRTITRTITDSDFSVPTTIARKGSRLYLPNAKFGTPPAGTPYEVVQVRTNKR